MNKQDYNLLDPFLLDGFLLTRSALTSSTALVIAVNFHRMTCSAFSRNQTLAISAEQFCCQQIFVLGFVLSGRFLVCGGSLLHLLKQLGRNDSGDSVGNDHVAILILSYVSAVVQHSCHSVEGDLRSSNSADTFDIQLVGDFLHRCTFCIFLESIKNSGRGNGINLEELIFVNGVSDRKCAAVVFALERVFGQTSYHFFGELGRIVFSHTFKH
ncbi:unknown [Candidatus Apopatosoma intestinale]|nr:unknown [Candidatus Apopatosoma intestinale]